MAGCKRLHLTFSPSWAARSEGREKTQITSRLVIRMLRGGRRQLTGCVYADVSGDAQSDTHPSWGSREPVSAYPYPFVPSA